MRTFGSAARRAMMGLALLSIAACTNIYRNHGYAPTDFELAEIEVGTDTRETVASAVGRPSTEALLQNSAWYYVQSRYRRFAYRAPEEIERQVVAISFAPDGTVENVERFGLEQGRVVALSRRVTSTNIRGVGLLSQLLGNLGNVQADQLLE